MFHTNLVVSYHVSHISGRVALTYHLFTPTAIFKWLIAIIFDLVSRDPRPQLVQE